MTTIRKDLLESYPGSSNLDSNPVEWFYNPLKGQPRYVNILKLRQISKTESIAFRIDLLIHAVLRRPYVIKGKRVKQFFSKIDFRHELRAFLEDLLVLDAGVFVKGFSPESYKRLKDGSYQLKPLGKRKLIELWARDGGSFLKETDVNGVVYRYWQYSYLHAQVAPIEFGVNEIAYCSWHPRSYSCYGESELQWLEWPSRLRRIFRRRQPLALQVVSIAELQELVERTMNRDIMPEFGKDAHFQFIEGQK